MLIIPLVPGKNQTLKVVLTGQLCQINLYENSTGVYIDLYVNAVLIRSSVLCLNLVEMISEEYLGFVGRLRFNDTLGLSDPTINLVGTRYQLQYLEPGIDY